MKYTREIETLRRQVKDAFPPPEHFRIAVNIHTREGLSDTVHITEFDAYMGAIPRQENYREYELSRTEYEALSGARE